MDKEDFVNLFGCIGMIVLALFLALIMPLVYAVGGYFTGLILASAFQFAGQWIVDGAKSIGIEITLSSLAPLGAFLAFVGSFFKSHQSNTNKSK